MTRRKLNLGCGPGPQPVDWICLDGSWNAWFAKRGWARSLVERLRLAPAAALEHRWDPSVIVHDVERGLPFADRSLSAIYSSHMLEHLYADRAERLLRDCHRVLEPGGLIRIVVPDLRATVDAYLSADDARALRADVLNERLMFRPRAMPAGGWAFRAYSAVKDFHSHKWMYDAESLTARLEAAGFADVRRMAAHQSRIAGIERVERADRVADGGLCLEAVRS